MYSKEQMSTRLKLGATISTSELILVVKSLLEKIEELTLYILEQDQRMTNLEQNCKNDH